MILKNLFRKNETIDKISNFLEKFQLGGVMQNDLLSQVVQLVQSAFNGDQQAVKQIEEILQAALQGDQQATQIAQLIQQVVLSMLQSPKARLGTKLNYIRKIKGLCPDGEELVYMEQGGKICKVCQKKKIQEGGKVKKDNPVEEFKNKRINPADTVWVDGKKENARTLTDESGNPIIKGMKPYSAKEYQKDFQAGRKGNKAAYKRALKQDMKTAYACGGKAKKK